MHTWNVKWNDTLVCLGVWNEVRLFGSHPIWLSSKSILTLALPIRDKQRIDRDMSKITDPHLELIQSSARAHRSICTRHYSLYLFGSLMMDCLSKIPIHIVDWVNQRAMGVEEDVYHGITKYIINTDVWRMIYISVRRMKKKQGAHTCKSFLYFYIHFVGLRIAVTATMRR